MPDSQIQILLADDDEMSRTMFARILSEFTGHEVIECGGGLHAKKVFEQSQPPVVISDIRMPGFDGLDLLRAIRAHPEGQDIQVILMTGFADLETALTAMREEANEMLTKPIPVTDLLETVERAIKRWQTAKSQKSQEPAAASTEKNGTDKQSDRLVRTTINLPDGTVIGVFSRKMRLQYDTALQYHEDRSVPVLIQGETGTGKEMIARVVHYGTEGETARPFVSVNCAAISASLFESELFGYVGGAFTGALPKGAKGKLELANNGTIFLDEVGEIPLPMQAKLLRALQDREIYKVGGTERIPLDIRVIAATNRDLENQVKQSEFRSDLYYRLAVGRITVPPLREQRTAIPALAQLFLSEFAENKQRDFRFISREAINLFEKFDWPGNIRQLRNLIEHAVLLHNAIELDASHLAELEHRVGGSGSALVSNGNVLRPGSIALPEDNIDLDEIIYEIVHKALEKFGNNQSRTAEYLGLSRGRLRTLLGRMDEG